MSGRHVAGATVPAWVPLDELVPYAPAVDVVATVGKFREIVTAALAEVGSDIPTRIPPPQPWARPGEETWTIRNAEQWRTLQQARKVAYLSLGIEFEMVTCREMLERRAAEVAGAS